MFGEGSLTKAPESVASKVSRLVAGGRDRLQVVADWDRTLTTARTLSGRDQSTYAILYDGGYLGPDYQRRSELLYRTFRESERSADLDPAAKSRDMERWWELQFGLMLEFGFSLDSVDQAIAEDRVRVRQGALELVRLLSDLEVPLLILSAGITPFITRYLKARGVLSGNVTVVANDLEFDAGGLATGYTRPLIHSLNKHRADLKPQADLTAAAGRPNLVLLGDTLEDIQAAAGIQHRCQVCFGFPESSTHPSLPAYLDAYDVIIPDDGPLTPVLDLIGQGRRMAYNYIPGIPPREFDTARLAAVIGKAALDPRR